MKKEAVRKPKFLKLCRRLNKPIYQVQGVLECLWFFTADQCPRGDIGRFSDEEIALALDWELTADSLVEALVETKWLDTHPEYRLLVHDWAQHCNDSVHMSLARQGLTFADGSIPRDTRLSKKHRETRDKSVRTESAQCAHSVRTDTAHCAHLPITDKPITNNQLPITDNNTDTDTDTDIKPNEVGSRKPQRIGSLLESVIGDFIKPLPKSEVLEAGIDVFGEPWRKWLNWTLAQPCMANGALSEIYEEIKYVQVCQSGTRPELSSFKYPQRALAQRFVKVLQRHGVRRWPKFPT